MEFKQEQAECVAEINIRKQNVPELFGLQEGIVRGFDKENEQLEELSDALDELDIYA